MSASVEEGWYTDPVDSRQQRWWDGSVWTERTRVPPTDADPPAEPPRRSRTGLIAGLLTGVVALTAAVVVFGVLDLGNDDQEAASDDEPIAADDEPTEDTGDQEPDDVEPDIDPPEDQGPSVGDVTELDAEDQTYRLVLSGVEVSVQLEAGRGQLQDGRNVGLVTALTQTADLTGDGVDELVAIVEVDGPDAPSGDPTVAIGVIRLDDDGRPSPMAPPQLMLPEPGSPEPFAVGRVEAVGVVDGALEVALMTPPAGERLIDIDGDGVDPLAENRRRELQLRWSDGSWEIRADGPVTREARRVADAEGVAVDDLVCDGRANVAGSHPVCVDVNPDSGVLVSLLMIDDAGGYRAVVATDGVASTGTEVRRELGDEAFCRDINEALTNNPSLGWQLPMAALSYWLDQGRPERMDASRNGIPCQTVFDGMEPFLTEPEGRVEDTYAARASG